jgi:cardiolipin synthase
MTNSLCVLRMPYANLRSHRKILVVDGQIKFTGGMNIRAAFVRALTGANTNANTHFCFEGPIVTQLMTVFSHDWNFTTRESLNNDAWLRSAPLSSGNALIPMRCVPSGPDRTLGSSHSMLLDALAVAQRQSIYSRPIFYMINL